MKLTDPYIAASVQASPVYLNVAATIEKVCSLMEEAANNGAKLIAFPEVFVAGYPYWNWITDPVSASPYFQKLYQHGSVDLDSQEMQRVYDCAQKLGLYVVLGVNERGEKSLGTIYNTLVIIGPEGYIARHRKLVPTWAEKLTWTGGDGHSLQVYDTEIGPLGALACGENTNTLARFTLLARGELVHVASYISLPTAPPDYDMAEAIKIRTMAHSFEGKLFSLVSCSTVSEEIISEMSKLNPECKALFERKRSSYTGIIGPDGRELVEPLIDKDGIVYAEIDLSKCIQPKQMHDIIGHYNRFDIFELKVNGNAVTPIQKPEYEHGK